MLPMQSREEFKEAMPKMRTKYNNCRKIYFEIEDNLNSQVLNIKKARSGKPESESELRQRQLGHLEDLYGQEHQLKKIQEQGKETTG